MFSFNNTKESLNKLAHYGSYSYIALNKNQVTAKEKNTMPNGIKIFGR